MACPGLRVCYAQLAKRNGPVSIAQLLPALSLPCQRKCNVMAIVRTVQHVIDAYLRHMRVRFDVAVPTFNKSVAYLTEFGRMFGPKKLATAQRNDLMEFVAAHPNWKSGWTKNDAIGIA